MCSLSHFQTKEWIFNYNYSFTMVTEPSDFSAL